MSVLTVKPKFLYPHSRQFPFDEVAEKIVRELKKRNFDIPGIEVELDSYGSGEEKYIYPYIEDVDVIFNSSLIYEPAVMKTFAQPLLLQLDKSSKFYAESRRLYEYLNNFLPMETSNIPIDSLIREFIGNGCFNR